MKKINRLKKELERMKRWCMHCMILKEVEDIESKQKHYLFNCGRMDLKRIKGMYKGLKKTICDRQNLVRFGSCIKCFVLFEWCNR